MTVVFSNGRLTVRLCQKCGAGFIPGFEGQKLCDACLFEEQQREKARLNAYNAYLLQSECPKGVCEV